MIVHICSRQAWQQAQAAGEYRAASLADEGFIHASRPDQALRTANRYYHGQDDLLLLVIDPQRLTAPLKHEPSDNDTFPHIYGALNLEAVVQVLELPHNPDGGFTVLPLLPS